MNKNNGGGNPNHDEEGKFTSKVMNQMGLNEKDVENDKPERRPIKLDVPKHHTEKDEKGIPHIVIDEGRFKGNRYASEEDFLNTERKNEEQFRDKVIEFYKKTNFPGKFDDEWFENMQEPAKQLLRGMFARSETSKALEKSFELPENKAKILANLRRLQPIYNNLTDDEIWKDMSLEKKKLYFKM